MFTLQNREQSQLDKSTFLISYSCVYPPKSRAVATIHNNGSNHLRLCLPSKIESSRNKVKNKEWYKYVVFTLQNREQSQHINGKRLVHDSCVYPPKSRAVATDTIVRYHYDRLCLPSKIESSRNKIEKRCAYCWVVFTLQNREQSQRSTSIMQSLKCCVYPPKSRAVATKRSIERITKLLCLPSKIESSRNLNVFWLQNVRFYRSVKPVFRKLKTWQISLLCLQKVVVFYYQGCQRAVLLGLYFFF